MAGIQIPPKVDRVQVNDAQSVGRVNARIDNGAATFGDTANKLVSAVSETKNAFDKAMEDGAKVTAADAGNQYDQWRQSSLKGLKDFKGNPTEVFSKFDEESQKQQQALLEKYKDAPDITRQMIRQKLSEVHARTNVDRLVQEHIQSNAYADGVSKAAADNAGQSLLSLTSVFDPKDEHSVAMFDAGVDEIRKPLYDNNIRKGLITKNPDGTIKEINPIAQDDIRQTVSKKLRDAITNLNENGQPEKADFLIKKYASEIAPQDLNALQKGNKDSVINDKALNALVQIKHMEPKAAFAWIDKNVPDLEVAEKLRAKYSTLQGQIAATTRDAQAQAFNDAVNRVRGSGTKFVSVEALHDDPVIKNLIPRMSLEQQQKIEKYVFKPAVSDPKQIAQINQARVNGDFYTMNAQDLEESLAGLSEKDHRKYRSIWERRNDPSEGQNRAAFSFMHDKILIPELLNQNMIKPNRTGHYDVSDLKIINQFSEQVDKAMENYQVKGIEDQRKLVRDLIANGPDGIKDRARKGMPGPTAAATPQPFNGTTTPAPTPKQLDDASALKIFNSLNDGQLADALKLWKKNNNGQSFSYKNNKVRDLIQSYQDSQRTK